MIKKFIKENRGASAPVIIIGILISAGIMFYLPLQIVSSKQDKAATLAAQTAVTEAVNSWATKGTITQEDIDNLQLKLNAVGRVYDMEIEIGRIDENAAKKVAESLSSSVYVTEYTTNILDELEKNKVIKLNEKDTITAMATPQGDSISDQLGFKSTNKETVQASSMVSKSAN